MNSLSSHEPIGVLGAGTMGSQIVAALVLAGFPVILWNVNDPSQSLPTIRQWIRLGIRRTGSELDADKCLMLIRTTTTLETLAPCQAVIEAVIEDLAIKQKLLGQIEAVCKKTRLIGTNTSSLDLQQVGARLEAPEKLLGLHFFNPMIEIDLVEIITTPRSSEEAIHLAQNLVQTLKKKDIAFSESITNRILFPMINEATRVVEQGKGTRESVDQALRWGAKHPIGPLALADLIGIDVVVAILESLQSRLGEHYRPTKTLYNLKAKGHLGKKSGQGFYTYGKTRNAAS